MHPVSFVMYPSTCIFCIHVSCIILHQGVCRYLVSNGFCWLSDDNLKMLFYHWFIQNFIEYITIYIKIPLGLFWSKRTRSTIKHIKHIILLIETSSSSNFFTVWGLLQAYALKEIWIRRQFPAQTNLLKTQFLFYPRHLEEQNMSTDETVDVFSQSSSCALKILLYLVSLNIGA